MTHPRIRVPEEIEGLTVVASVSGGKDSTALMLALREAGIKYRAVFADTGWEADETYAYLDLLRERIGPIEVVGVPGGMRAKIEARAGFPARKMKWCTQELKLEPLREYHDTLSAETVSVVGIRAEESPKRALMAKIELDEEGPYAWGGWVWRPLIDWTIEDVLGIHNAHGVPVNPLYQRGHSRVGCYPCIHSTKEDIRLIAEYAPSRIDELRDIERFCTAERAKRNAEKPGRYAHDKATFFQVRRPLPPHDIDMIVSWSRTSKGGRQLPLLPPPPTGGCMRWGLCDMPASEGEEGDS